MKYLLLILVFVASTVSAAWWQPVPNTRMHIQYSGTLSLTDAKVIAADAINLDLVDTTQTKINQLKAANKKIICYFSAGSWEDWRPDAALFPASVKGNTMDGWPDEKWLDIRSATVVNRMKARIDLAASKGCDAVDPDNTDGWDGNSTGFPLTQLDTQTYLATLAAYAHSKNLAIGLKNNPNLVNMMYSYHDFSVVEQCHEFQECPAYQVMVSTNKPVWQIEYNGTLTAVCNAAAIRNFDAQKKTLALSASGTQCR